MYRNQTGSRVSSIESTPEISLMYERFLQYLRDLDKPGINHGLRMHDMLTKLSKFPTRADSIIPSSSLHQNQYPRLDLFQSPSAGMTRNSRVDSNMGLGLNLNLSPSAGLNLELNQTLCGSPTTISAHCLSRSQRERPNPNPSPSPSSRLKIGPKYQELARRFAEETRDETITQPALKLKLQCGHEIDTIDVQRVVRRLQCYNLVKCRVENCFYALNEAELAVACEPRLLREYYKRSTVLEQCYIRCRNNRRSACIALMGHVLIYTAIIGYATTASRDI